MSADANAGLGCASAAVRVGREFADANAGLGCASAAVRVGREFARTPFGRLGPKGGELPGHGRSRTTITAEANAGLGCASAAVRVGREFARTPFGRLGPKGGELPGHRTTIATDAGVRLACVRMTRAWTPNS